MPNNICREFRHGYHVKGELESSSPGKPKRKDAVIVKELLHMPDGTTKKNLVIYEDLKRPFYITKPYYRNHKQKKEREHISKLDKFEATDTELPKEVMRRLGKRAYGKVSMRDVRMSPYVYGTEVDIVTLLKYEYGKKCDKTTPYEIMFYDIENDPDTHELNLLSIIYKEGDRIKVHLYTHEKYTAKYPNYTERVMKLWNEQIPDLIPKDMKKYLGYDPFDHIDIKINIAKDEMDLIRSAFVVLHHVGYDILTAWGGWHDISTIEERCLYHGVDPNDIFCDPSIPKEYRERNIKQGRTTMVTQAGAEKRLDPQEQWHMMRFPAKFYIVDFMATYYFNRRGGQKVYGGYSLENMASIVLGVGKLHLETIEGVSKALWHKLMVRDHFIDYTVYNIWDSLLMLFMEAKTGDLSIQLPLQCGVGTFDRYDRTPSLVLDDFHFYLLERDYILGTDVVNETYESELDRKKWVVTVEAWRTVSGDHRRLPGTNLLTNFRFYTYDSDQVSGYPSDTVVTNLSKETCVREVIKIEGHEPDNFKRQTINLMGGYANHVQFMREMFNAPTFKDLAA